MYTYIVGISNVCCIRQHVYLSKHSRGINGIKFLEIPHELAYPVVPGFIHYFMRYYCGR